VLRRARSSHPWALEPRPYLAAEGLRAFISSAQVDAAYRPKARRWMWKG